jgi:hypothetical protein
MTRGYYMKEGCEADESSILSLKIERLKVQTNGLAAWKHAEDQG